MHLVATRDLKEGDEITVSYVDSTVHDGETIEEAARRRRQELARGWKFKCECSRCLIEVASNQEKEADLGVENDESKLEKTVERLERPDLTEGSWIPVAPDVE